MILSSSYTTKIKVFTVKKTKKCLKFFFNHLHIRIASNHPYWPKAIRIWRWSEKNLRHFLVFLTAPIFVNKAYFFLFPISSTQQLPHFCFKPISVIHIWKAFNVYFLNYFVGTALFSKKCITFRWLNENKIFLTVFSGQCLTSRQPIFLGYLKPHRASWWLILKLISMLWQ